MNYVVDILDNIFKEPRNVGISVSQKFQPLELTQTKKKKKTLSKLFKQSKSYVLFFF